METDHIPEVDDMQRFWETRCLPRYVQGHQEYGTRSCELAPLTNLRDAAEELADASFYLRQAERKLEPQEGRLRVYIAGPYRADTYEQQVRYIQQAREAMAAVYQRGHSPFSPISMTAWLDVDHPEIPNEAFLTTDLDWPPLCHAILLLPGWTESEGAKREHQKACELGLLVIQGADELPWLKRGSPAVGSMECYGNE